MKSKLIQSSYFGFISLAVVAPTVHASMLPDDSQVIHSPAYLRKLILEQSYLDAPFAIQKRDLTAPVLPARALASAPSVAPKPIARDASPIPSITQAGKARILVVDAQALNFGKIVPITTAVATWIGSQSKLETKSSEQGVINAPYPKTRAQRFIVNAEGYIPAVGYAVMGTVAVAPMYKAALVQPLVQTLDIKDINSHIVIGKALDGNLSPVAKLRVDLSQIDSKVNYSLGSWGIFMPDLIESGPSGDFVVTGLEDAIQYFMPVDNESAEEWPSTVMDLSGMPQVVSIALPKAEREFSRTKTLDGFVLEKPESQVNLTIGGQRGVYIPDADGETFIENLYTRPAVDVLEVRANSYLKSWIHTPAIPKLMPAFSPLLTAEQVQQMLDPAQINWSSTQGIVIGSVKTSEYQGKPLAISVMGPSGRAVKDASIVYFDDNNNASSEVHSTEFNGRFMIVGLDDGEWSLLAVEANPVPGTKAKGLGATVLRTSAGVLSFIEI